MRRVSLMLYVDTGVLVARWYTGAQVA